jgi:hypothetical protein
MLDLVVMRMNGMTNGRYGIRLDTIQVMAELIELGRVPFTGKRSESLITVAFFVDPQRGLYSNHCNARSWLLVLEIGASTSLPTLLASTSENPPERILTTDYPDEALIK